MYVSYRKKTMLKKILNWLKPKTKSRYILTFNEPVPSFPVEKPKKRPTLKKATTKEPKMATKPGLYANIHKKQARIEKEKAEGKPVEKMRKPGTKGAPTAKAFKESAKTAKKK